MTGWRLLTYAAAFGLACIAAGVALAFGAYEGTNVCYRRRLLLVLEATWRQLTGE